MSGFDFYKIQQKFYYSFINLMRVKSFFRESSGSPKGKVYKSSLQTDTSIETVHSK